MFNKFIEELKKVRWLIVIPVGIILGNLMSALIIIFLN